MLVTNFEKVKFSKRLGELRGTGGITPPLPTLHRYVSLMLRRLERFTVTAFDQTWNRTFLDNSSVFLDTQDTALPLSAYVSGTRRSGKISAG